MIDKTTREPIPFGNVVVKLNGIQKGYGQTDINGSYSISPLTPGTYTLELPNVGYITKVINGIQVSVDKTTNVNVELDANVKLIEQVEIVTYKAPLIGPDKQGEVITQEEIKKLPAIDVSTIATTASGVFASDDNSAINIRGTRSGATGYFVNGVRQLVAPSLPPSAIGQMTVITRGIPAQYGDVTGGIINITTTSPAGKLAGGLEAETSAPFDKYNNNRFNFNLTGPLIQKKNVDTTNLADNSNRTILGFFLAAQYQTSRDDNPVANDLFRLKSDVKERITNNPYILDPNGLGYTDAAQNITFNDMEKVKVRENVASNRLNVNGSFDFQPKENMMFTIGGNWSRSDRNMYVNSYSLFNPENNPQQIINNYNTFLRFTQSFKDNANDSTQTLKNAYYQIQADYSKYDRVIQNERLKDDIFEYGYVGKFDVAETTVYEPNGTIRLLTNPNDPNDTTTTLFTNVNIDRGQLGTGVSFTPSGNNPELANYTSQVINDRIEAGNPITNLTELQIRRGVLNGFSPQPIYSIFTNTGTIYPAYQRLNNDQYRVSALGSAEWRKHTFKVGFEFEQRVETFYFVNGNSLWLVGRGLLGTENTGLDVNNYTVRTDDNGQTFIDFENKVGTQGVFTTNLRNKLGLKPTDDVNIDALSPDDLAMDMFSADELIVPGVIDYQGYTFDGKRNTKRSSFNDFFADPLNRPQDAIRPIYAAAFIEDKFQVDDLTLRVGVRVDRFDANQRVLKDPFALVDVMKASEVRDLTFADGYTIPSNIGNDYVVYVNKSPRDFSTDPGVASSFAVTGYRQGEVFYDLNGTPTENINQITQNGTFPLFDPARQGEEGVEYLPARGLSVRAFKDYEPQINISPRLAFSFPISEDALFFANYDILTQRPERNGTQASDYFFLNGSVGSRNQINNPDLRPSKKIDYEVGFEQRISRSSSLTISAFYSELRDQVSYRRYIAAYPQDYITFANLDFGVVKGMTLEYDLRRTANMQFGASYTLQFAKGTGSSATSGFNLVSQGQSNLRTPIPLDYDQRHAFKLNMDFRLLNDEGPVLFDKKVFENMGLNFTLNAGSGTPYSRQANVTNYIFAIGRPVLAGSVNGSRLPANIRAGLRIDKDFNLTSK
ncbi:MAG TPA: TonB-dependent receptor, partial [Adhaeribacter sp.]|nr:TonB-dependent receptor [Adhaeribacter sp.]